MAQADVKAQDIRVENGDFYFDFKGSEITIKNINPDIAGLRKYENATAAIEVALRCLVRIGSHCSQFILSLLSFGYTCTLLVFNIFNCLP